MATPHSLAEHLIGLQMAERIASFSSRVPAASDRSAIRQGLLDAERNRIADAELRQQAVKGYHVRTYAVVPCEKCRSLETKSCGHARFNAWIRRKVYCKDCQHTTLIELTPEEMAAEQERRIHARC